MQVDDHWSISVQFMIAVENIIITEYSGGESPNSNADKWRHYHRQCMIMINQFLQKCHHRHNHSFCHAYSYFSPWVVSSQILRTHQIVTQKILEKRSLQNSYRGSEFQEFFTFGVSASNTSIMGEFQELSVSGFRKLFQLFSLLSGGDLRMDRFPESCKTASDEWDCGGLMCLLWMENNNSCWTWDGHWCSLPCSCVQLCLASHGLNGFASPTNPRDARVS